MRMRRGAGARAVMVFLALTVSWTGTVQTASAQQRPDRDRLEAQIRDRFHELVQRELGLDDASLERLTAELDVLQEERRELGMRQRQLRRNLASTGTLLSDDQAQAVLDELLTVQEEELTLLRREQERLREVLTAPQLVRFYTLRERFADRVRELRRRGPGGGGPPDVDGPFLL